MNDTFANYSHYNVKSCLLTDRDYCSHYPGHLQNQ